MRRRMGIGLLAVMMLIGWVLPVMAQEAEDDWTVLVYLCGTDLETEDGFASYNLLEMMEAEASDRVNIVVQTGGTEKWQLDEVDPGKLQRFEIAGGGMVKVDEQPLANMGDAKTLSDFVSWGAAAYPAEKTMLILWNHGGGSVWGIAYDELYDWDSLSTPELAQALADANVPLEVIGFDACLMATLEVASALSPYARYMVASEESEAGDGWDYTAFLSYLAQTPEADGQQLGKVICDTFYAKSAAGSFGEITTLSVVDLAKIPTLETAFEAMALEMTGVTGDVEALRTFKIGAKRAESYGGNTPREGYSNMVDLGDLTIKTQSVLSDTAIDVLDALFSAVVYQVNGDLRKSANGLSVFFPLLAEEEELELFRDIAIGEDYYRFVVAYSSLEMGDEGGGSGTSSSGFLQSVFEGLNLQLPDTDEYEVEFYTYFDDDNVYSLEFVEGFDIVETVEFSLYLLDYEDEELIELGYDNDLYADWEEGFFQDNFYGYWPTLDGYPCALYLIGEGDDYNLYSVPILLNGEEAYLRAQYIWEEEDEYFEILGVWNGVDAATGMSDRNYRLLAPGDEVDLLFTAYPLDSGEELLYSMGSFTVGDEPVVMELGDLPDGEYLFQYEVTTIFGEVYVSEAVLMEMDDGEIYVDWLAE